MTTCAIMGTGTHQSTKGTQMLKDIVKGFVAKHTPPVLSILISIGGASYYLGNLVQDGFVTMKSEMVYEARIPYYLSQEYALKKQLEKLEKDPADLKTSDVELQFIQCADEFGLTYIPSLPANRRSNAERTCDRLSDLYVGRSVY